MEKDEIIQIFQDALEQPLNPHMAEWISSGGKVAGCYCSLVPGEIFTAAGMAPYRIRGAGSEDTADADVYLSPYLCSFIRHTSNLALDGRFGFIDALVATNGCDQSRRAYDIWEKKTDTEFCRVISVPRTQDQNNFAFYLEELKNLVVALQAHFDVKIDPEKLSKAIKIHNGVRKNLSFLHDLLKRPDPPLTGAQASAVTIAAQVMPLEPYNRLLEDLLKALETAPGETRKIRARLAITGGEMDEPELVAAIENQGALVVYEDTCFGARYYEEPVAEDGDPLTSIAQRYFFRMPCARMEASMDKRYENLKKISPDYNTNGYIVQRLNHCILNSGHTFVFNRKAKSDGTPLLILDREYLSRGYGQINTRVQAFIESLESGALR